MPAAKIQINVDRSLLDAALVQLEGWSLEQPEAVVALLQGRTGIDLVAVSPLGVDKQGVMQVIVEPSVLFLNFLSAVSPLSLL